MTGYPSSENTWEPEYGLANCIEILAAYRVKKKMAAIPIRRSRTNRFTVKDTGGGRLCVFCDWDDNPIFAVTCCNCGQGLCI